MQQEKPKLKPTYFVGLDLGQTVNATALTVLERQPRKSATQPRTETMYHVPWLKRFQLGTPYTEIVREVTAMFERPELQNATLIVDQTGVGAAVVDMFRQAKPKAQLVPIHINPGSGAGFGEDGLLRVAKKELVSVLQVLLQTHRLKVSDQLPDAKVLVKELQNFRVKITAAANETFEAWRDGDHDDLVLATTLATWFAEVLRPISTDYIQQVAPEPRHRERPTIKFGNRDWMNRRRR